MPSGAPGPVPGVELRRVEPHELDALVACMEAGFATRYSPAERERWVASLDPAGVVGAFDGGELVGALTAQRTAQTMPGGAAVAALALTSVAVLPTHRRRGILSALMASLLVRAREEGDPLVVLGASEGAIYGRFGFGPATWSARYLIERHGAALRPGLEAAPGAVRLLSAAEAAEAFPAVFDAAVTMRPGEVERDADGWLEFFAEADSLSPSEWFFAAYEEDGRFDGYVAYTVAAARAPTRKRELVVVELVHASAPAYRALWSYVLGIDLVTEIRTLGRPVDEALRHLLADPRALQTTEIRDWTWLRVVDAEAVLSARRYLRPGRLVVSLSDRQCPWNEKVLAVEVDAAGVGSVAPSASPPEVHLEASALAGLLLGGCGPAELALAGRLRAEGPGALERAAAMFLADPAPHCTIWL